jgi:uncharacterized protein
MEFAGRMCLTAAGSLAVAGANAQTTPASAGTTLYQEARAASAAGNYALAQRKSEAACRLGSADACSLAATWYNGGSPVMTVNAVKALPLYIRACELENKQSSACEEAGKLLSGGNHGITRDNLRARTYFKRACDLSGSFGRGCEQFATLVRGEGGKDHAPLSRSYYMRACEGYQTAGCLNAWLVNFAGWYGPKDLVKARSFAVRGCHDNANKLGNQEQSELCSAAAAMFRDGSGGAKDLKSSASFYKRACEGGNAGGCEELAGQYWEGEGVPMDQKAALILLRRSCELGSTSACGHLKD